MTWISTVTPSAAAAAAAAAARIEQDLQDILFQQPFPRIVLATGATPVRTYARLAQARAHVDWSRITVYQLDEYSGLAATDPRRFSTFLMQHVVRPLGPAFRSLQGEESDAEMRAYETDIERAGGLDLVLYGVGVNGHLGFNEPGTPFDAPSRRVRLTESTRSRIDTRPGPAPTHATTLGLRIMNRARRLRVLALGTAKRDAIARGLLQPPSTAVPLSSVQVHPDVHVFLDAAACPPGFPK